MLNVREAAIVAAVCALIYKYFIYPAFLSPLAKIPNAHFSAPFSQLWIMMARFQYKENRTIQKAHETHGPVVRVGPNDLSVNCVDNGLRSIYAGGFEKHAWYNLFANFDGVPTMFSTAHSKPHSVRKRMMSNLYSKSFLQSSPTMAAVSNTIIRDRLIPKLQSLARANGQAEVHGLFNTVTMDFVTAYMFGLCNSTNFIQQSDVADWWLDLYQSRKTFVFWPQEMPELTAILARFGIRLSPQWVADANQELERWCLQLCDAADKTSANMTKDDEAKHPENIPIVYRQLKTLLAAEASKSPDSPMTPKQEPQQRLAVASEMLDQLSAGEETSAIALTYLFHELCLHPNLQDSLRDEVLTLSPSLRATTTPPSESSMALPSSKSIDALPLLHASLMETLRLHPPIPGPEPRITPDKPNLTLGPFSNIPPNVRVASLPYSLHRNASVFLDPESFQPERWLTSTEEQKAEMHRWFWAFSSGGRMCIGSNLAIQEMKLIAATLLSNFRFGIVNDDGIEQEDVYTAQPKSQKLLLSLESL